MDIMRGRYELTTPLCVLARLLEAGVTYSTSVSPRLFGVSAGRGGASLHACANLYWAWPKAWFSGVHVLSSKVDSLTEKPTCRELL